MIDQCMYRPIRGILKKLAYAVTCSTLIALSAQRTHAVTIAYIDSGANQTLVASESRLSPGFDYINDDETAEDTTVNQQGTAIARVLLGQTDNSTILPQKVTEPGFGWQLAQGDSALESILGQADVRIIDINGSQPVSINLLQRAVANGKVIVTQAGDSGRPSPTGLARSISSLSGGGIIVGGVDQNNRITVSSNRAGDLQNHYLVAPASSPHANLSGTVIAKSNTAAAAAILLETSPNLSPRQAVEILLTSATDIGAPGVDAIYGHGLLNLEQALSPQGTTNVGGNDSGGSGSGALVALALIGGVGYALFGRSKKLKKTLIMDQYDRPFTTNLIARAPIIDDHNTASLLGFTSHEARIATRTNTTELGNTLTSVSVSEEHPAYTFGQIDGNNNASEQGSEQVVSISQQFKLKQMDITHMLNTPIAQSFGLSSAPRFAMHQTQNDLNSPYLGLSARGLGLVIGRQKAFSGSAQSNHQFGLALGDEQEKHRAPTQSMIYQGNLDAKYGTIGLQIAYTRENGSLLGGAANGPFSVRSSETISTMLGGTLNLSSNWALGGSYALGRTQVKAESGSLLSNFSSLYSASTSLSLQGHSIFRKDDSLRFSVHQPISFNKGTIGLTIPTSVDASNQVLFSQEDIQLDGLGTIETHYEVSYLRPLSKRATIQAKWLKRNNRVTQGTQQGIALTYSHQL